MESAAMLGLYETLSDFGKREAMDFIRYLVQREDEQIDEENRAFLAKLERSHQQFLNGQVVVKTMEELEAMAQ